MANTKQATFIVDVSAEAKQTRKSAVRFFSYDSKTAEIVIQAEKNKVAIPKSSISSVEIYFESVNSSFKPTGQVKWNDPMTIDSDGLFSYVLPDDLLNYQGLIAFEIYINYTNSDKSDSSNRIIYEQRTSAIDRAAGQIELVYIKDMETAKKEVADKAAEVKSAMEGFNSGLDVYAAEKKSEMDQFSSDVKLSADVETVKIQAELPKVKKVTSEETEKIKKELPIVQQVATTEKEKIRAVLSTVKHEADTVAAYADQRIKAYDAKFVDTDKKMNELKQSQTGLSNQLKETQQLITESSVYTKQESSANVINQIIGKEKAQIKLSTDFVGKIVGSVAENANSIKTGARSTIMLPSEFVYGATQANYDRLTAIDNINFPLNSATNNSFVQVLFDYDVVDLVNKNLNNDFWTLRNISTRVEKATFIKEKLVSLIGRFWNYGASPAGNKVSMAVYNNTINQLETKASHTNSVITKSDLTLETADYISNDGHVYFVVYAEKSDGSKLSSVLTDYCNLSLTIELSAQDQINYVIAAYHKPFEKQLNDLAQKVAALENK